MGNRKEIKHTGKIIGHLVRYLPRQETELGGGAMLVKEHKIGAFVQIQVDGKKFYTVRSEAVELELKEKPPTEELHAEVYNALVDAHPYGADREFTEHVNTRSRGKKTTTRRHELVE
jgi:hypothetical protein